MSSEKAQYYEVAFGLSATPFEVGSLLIQIAGFALLSIPLFLTYRQIHSAIFCEYTRRFAEVYPDLARAIRPVQQAGGYEKADAEDQIALRLQVGRYLNLCSEEYHLEQNGFLHRSTWKIWERALTEVLANECIRPVAAEAVDDFLFYREFHGFLKAKVESASK